MNLRQSDFPVFAVNSCPRNLSEVEAATLRLNCSDVKEFRNVYHCLPLSNLSLLVEFCYDGLSGLIEIGNCMVLANQHLNNHPCNHFTSGCPNVPYFPKKMFNFPACTQINKQNSCYLAEPSCPNISFVEGTTLPTLNAMGNNTVLTNDPSPVIIGVLLPFFLIGLLISIIWTRERHQSYRRGRKGNEATEFGEDCPLMTEDDATNEKQTYLEDKNFWKRYQKYLEEGSKKVCPISQIIILGEHGVGKTTLLYRLQGRSREEIEAIRPTRGVDCYQKQHSFIITQSQLKMNEKGISSLSADPELISGFSAETRIDEKEITERTIPESHAQPTKRNAEAQATETEYVEDNRNKDINLDESKEREIPGRVNSASKDNVDLQNSTGVRPEHSRQAEHYGQPKNDIQSNRGIQLEHKREPKHNKKPDYDTESLVPMIKAELEKEISQFGNKNDVVLDVLDFAGQGEYYATHQTYIRKDAIFILVVDTSKDVNQRAENHEMEEKECSTVATDKNQFLCNKPGVAFDCWTPRDYLYYWLNTIRMHGGNGENIIFVGTHKDQKRKDFDFRVLLRGNMNGTPTDKKYLMVITDLHRYDEHIENDLTKIKNFICDLIDKSRRRDQPAKWVKYSNRFDIIKRKYPIVSIEQVLEMVDHFDLGMSDTEVADMLDFFHSSGKIIFFNVDKLKETVILDIQWFIDCFKHIICDRKHVDEDCWFNDEEEKMLSTFHEKGVLDFRLYEKLLNQKDVPKQYWKILGEYQNKLGMMFSINNHKINANVTIKKCWYVPSINTQEFKPSSAKYESRNSSQILCFRFIDYLPQDLFGRVIVACVNSGNWHPYDFLLCKTGANMCYRHSSMDEGEQIYLFTSNRIITVQFIGKHSGKNGQTVRQEISNIVRQFCHFYASSTKYEVGFLCCKEEGYKENSVNHFVSIQNKFCQGCRGTCRDEWKDAESFWKVESNEQHPISAESKADPLQIACNVYFHVVKRSTEIAAKPKTPEGVSRDTDTTWLDTLVEIGQKLKNLHRNTGGLDEEEELKNIRRVLKNVSCGLSRDFRKEIFFLWTQKTYQENQGIPMVSIERSEDAQDEITIEAKADAAVLHYLWFRKTFQENRYRVLNPSEDEEGKFEFQKKEDRLVLKLKEFDKQDEGRYYVVVETKNGFAVSRGIVKSVSEAIPPERFMAYLKKGKTTVRHARGIVVGCAGAGKTTLLYSLMGKSLSEIKEIKSTRGLHVFEHTFLVRNGDLFATEDGFKKKPLIRIPMSALDEKNEQRDDDEFRIPMSALDEMNEQRSDDEFRIPMSALDEMNEQRGDDESMTEKVEKEGGDRAMESSQTDMTAGKELKTRQNPTLAPNKNQTNELAKDVMGEILDTRENEVSVSMIDFAGESAYYPCHQIYMRSGAFYILVLDMSKAFQDIVDSKTDEHQGSIFSTWSYKDCLHFWLDSIKSVGGSCAQVLAVATHTEGKTEKEKESFWESFWTLVPEEDRTWLQKCVGIKEFELGLTEMNEKGKRSLHSLKKSIAGVVSIGIDTKREVPSAWALLEHLLQKTEKPILSINGINEVNKELPVGYQLKSQEEIFDFLSFFHGHGLLLFFKEDGLRTHAIFDIQWFSNAFSKLIADKNHINRECKQRYIKEWNSFNKTGNLKNSLVDALWKEEPSYVEHKTELLSYVERLRMLVNIGESEGEISWYVPCMNKRPFTHDVFKQKMKKSPILCFRFKSFALFVYYRLIAYCMSSLKWSVLLDKDGLCLYDTAAIFQTKNHTVIVGIFHNDIQVQVLRIANLQPKVSCEIGKSIDVALTELTKTFDSKKTFQKGYKRLIIFLSENDLTFNPENKLSGLQCSCPIKEKREIDVQWTLGFWKEEVLYRLLRPGEDYSKGLFAKNALSNISVEEHVTSGSKMGQDSRFISCCKTIEAVEKFASRCIFFPKRIVKITLKYPTIQTIDLTVPSNQLEYFHPLNQKARNFANYFQEVLIVGSVPPDCLSLYSYNGHTVQ